MKSIEELQTTKSTFSIGRAFSDGWALVSKHLGYYIGAGILAALIGGAAGIIPFVGSLASNIILAPCFMASAIYITWRISRGIAWDDFGDMFKGFKYLTPIALSTLIQSVAVLILMLIFFFGILPEIIELFKLSQGPDVYRNQEEIRELFFSMFNAKNILLLILFTLAAMLVGAIWAFKSHFIVVYNMDAWPAMELSRRVCTPNILNLLLLFFLLGLIVIVSILPCGIGLLFSLPLSIGTLYSAFAQITHCDQPDEINKEMFDFVDESKPAQ